MVKNGWKLRVPKLLTYRIMKRISSIAALLLIATASMANAPKPEPDQAEKKEKKCTEVTIICDNAIVVGEVCTKGDTNELMKKVERMAEVACEE